MATNRIQETANILKMEAPVGGVTVDTPVLINDMLVMPLKTAAVGVDFAGQVGGVFDLAKQSSLAINNGDAVYWDDGNSEVDTTSTNQLIGVCAEDAAAADSTVKVALGAMPATLMEHGLISSTSGHLRKTAARAYDAVPLGTNLGATAGTQVADADTNENAYDDTLAIPANTLAVGDVVEVELGVKCDDNNGTDTLNVKLKIGSNILGSTGAVDVADGDLALIRARGHVQSIGASAEIHWFSVGGWSTAVDKGTVSGLVDTTFDSTGILTLSATSTWDAGHADNKSTIKSFSWHIHRN